MRAPVESAVFAGWPRTIEVWSAVALPVPAEEPATAQSSSAAPSTAAIQPAAGSPVAAALVGYQAADRPEEA